MTGGIVPRLKAELAEVRRELDAAMALCREHVAAYASQSETCLDTYNAIAKAGGFPEWEYPGQLVRDVEQLKRERDEAKLHGARMYELARGNASFSCHFCGRSKDEAKILIAGPAVFICDECVVLCVDIMATQAREAHVSAHEKTFAASSAAAPGKSAAEPSDGSRRVGEATGSAGTPTEPAGRSALSPPLVGDVAIVAKEESDLAEMRARAERGEALNLNLDAQFEVLRYRLATIVDKSCGMQPVMGADDLMTLLERHLFEMRRLLAEQMAIAGVKDPAGELESTRDEVKALQREVRDATIRAIAAEQNADCIEVIGWLAIAERDAARDFIRKRVAHTAPCAYGMRAGSECACGLSGALWVSVARRKHTGHEAALAAALAELVTVSNLVDGWDGSPDEAESPAPSVDAVFRARAAIIEGFERGLRHVEVDGDVCGGVAVTFYDAPENASRHCWIACTNEGRTGYVLSGGREAHQSGTMSHEAWPEIVAFLCNAVKL